MNDYWSPLNIAKRACTDEPLRQRFTLYETWEQLLHNETGHALIALARNLRKQVLVTNIDYEVVYIPLMLTSIEEQHPTISYEEDEEPFLEEREN